MPSVLYIAFEASKRCGPTYMIPLGLTILTIPWMASSAWCVRLPPCMLTVSCLLTNVILAVSKRISKVICLNILLFLLGFPYFRLKRPFLYFDRSFFPSTFYYWSCIQRWCKDNYQELLPCMYYTEM